MEEEISGGRLIAVPFDLSRGNTERVTRLLDWMSSKVPWFASGPTPEQARIDAAWMLTDPSFWKWEIWNGGKFAGMILLSRVAPRVDALMHFSLIPHKDSGVTLFSSRRLLWNFFGYAFDAFQLQRISAEVPEHVPKYIRFLRDRMGFRLEGTDGPADKQKIEGFVRFGKDQVSLREARALTWMAGFGARRERAHWDPVTKSWSDLILLRLLRSEYHALVSSGKIPTTGDPPGSLPSAASAALGGPRESRRETSTISAIDASRNAGGLSGRAV